MALLTAYAWSTSERTDFWTNNSCYTFTYLGDTKTVTLNNGTEVAFYRDATGDITVYSAVAFNVDGTTSVLGALSQREEAMIELINTLT